LLLVTDRPFTDWLAEVHPPLYYALLLAWTQVSTSDRWLRALSAVLGALTVPAVYVLGAAPWPRQRTVGGRVPHRHVAARVAQP
jgi:uncharacterized membrane protein